MATLRQTSSANTPRRPCMWPKPIGRLTKSVLQSFAPSVGKNTSMARELDSKRSVRNSRSPAAARSTTRSRRPSAGRSSAKSVSKSMSPKSIGSTKRNARPKVKRFAMVMDMINIANMCLKKFVTRWEKKYEAIGIFSQFAPDMLCYMQMMFLAPIKLEKAAMGHIKTRPGSVI